METREQPSTIDSKISVRYTYEGVVLRLPVRVKRTVSKATSQAVRDQSATSSWVRSKTPPEKIIFFLVLRQKNKKHFIKTEKVTARTLIYAMAYLTLVNN